MTAGLFRHLGVKRSMTPYHDHNADTVRPGLVARMATEAVALVSDAGTPLISDPGYKLVRDARAAGHAVVTIPGPCAAIAALTLAGLPTDRFLFLGFLPSKQHARAEAIAEVAGVRATMVLYELGPRLAACLSALAEGLGDREAAVAREITKKFEECVTGTLTAARRALCRSGAPWRDRHRRRPARRGGARHHRGRRRGVGRSPHSLVAGQGRGGGCKAIGAGPQGALCPGDGDETCLAPLLQGELSP